MKPRETMRPWRNYSVYDLEWVPGTLQIRTVGCFDGERFYSYETIHDFLASMLSSDNSGRWFYAHAGGLADVQFVLESLIGDPRYNISAAFSGSSAIIVDIRRGRNRWRFVDSYWLLRDTLARIGEHMGMPKGGPTDGMSEEQVKAWYANVPLPELIDYNEQDCRILYRAIYNFEMELMEMGGSLQATVASCAMDLFRRVYLRSELPCSVRLNEKSRLAYVASRVEVFEKEVGECDYYDINSSFPYSMTKPLPGRIDVFGLDRIPDNGTQYLAHVTLKAPESYMPPLPYRYQNRIFFPQGSWDAWLFWPDVECLLEAGGDILKVHEVLTFHPMGDDLASYANDIYTRRKRSSGFKKIVYKYLLNSLYGKFAESPTKEKMHINPNPQTLARLDRSQMLMPGVFVESFEAKIVHEHVALSACITAHSRRALYDFMKEAREVYYCDTDGFAVSPDTSYTCDNELGGLKLEKQVRRAKFVRPKVYELELTDGTKIHKAKGFSLGRDAERKFIDIIEGRDIELTRMARIKENLKRGVVVPWETVITKGLRENFPKRSFDGAGKSRPWDVKEIWENLA